MVEGARRWRWPRRRAHRAARATVLGSRALAGVRPTRSVPPPCSVAVVVSERLARYGFGDGHPFGPDRLAAFVREFEARGLPRA